MACWIAGEKGDGWRRGKRNRTRLHLHLFWDLMHKTNPKNEGSLALTYEIKYNAIYFFPFMIARLLSLPFTRSHVHQTKAPNPLPRVAIYWPGLFHVPMTHTQINTLLQAQISTFLVVVVSSRFFFFVQQNADVTSVSWCTVLKAKRENRRILNINQNVNNCVLL